MSAVSLAAEDLLDSLTRVVDPATHVNIVDLGLVYGVELDHDRATIEMTLRSNDDPNRGAIEENVRQTLLTRHPTLKRVVVDLVWEPVWQDHFMTEEGRRQFESPILRHVVQPGETLNDDDILDSLHFVLDPEVGINIVDLGLVYDVALDGMKVDLIITMTTRACPLQATIEDAIRRTLAIRHPELTDVAIHVVWDPPWDTDRITDAGRTQLGW